MDVSLPPITIYVMNTSYFIQDYFVYILCGMVLSVFFILIARKHSRRFRKIIDALLLKIPLLGTVISASVLAFITEYFSLLINIGMDILKSVTILKESIRNEVYREKLGEVRESLTRGEGIADSFKGAVIFPVFVTRMLSIGEMSGTLSEQLAYIAEEYKNKLNIIVATIGKTLEPVVLVVAGSMFAIIIGALLLPIYDLVSQLSAR
jgi:general secretion pathway protein F/type IV pilus assembly protein PilC